jgi:hypothetical protein
LEKVDFDNQEYIISFKTRPAAEKAMNDLFNKSVEINSRNGKIKWADEDISISVHITFDPEIANKGVTLLLHLFFIK